MRTSINDIFSVPIYQSPFGHVEIIREEINKAIEQSDFKNEWQPDNDTATTTYVPNKETNVIEKFDMSIFKKGLMYHCYEYLKQTQQPFVDNTLQVDASWINIFSTKELIGYHEHGYQPNMISGVYYHEAPENCGDIIFKSSNPYTVSFPHPSPLYNNLFKIKAIQGNILLFPSWILHKVEPNKSENQRSSLSFNVTFDYTYYSRNENE
tara:strand:- start:2720 stop:3346 length:627 start_codon:yes stop_codon:yes gene_type:complete